MSGLFALTPCVPLSRRAGEGELQGAPPCAPTPLAHAGEGAPPCAPTPLAHAGKGALPCAPFLSHALGEGLGVRAIRRGILSNIYRAFSVRELPPSLRFPLLREGNRRVLVPHACRGNLKEGVLSINADSAPPADTNLQEGVSSLITAYCDYGVRFVCAVGMGNLHAVQFHPEKSSETGLQILRNFLALVGAAACSL